MAMPTPVNGMITDAVTQTNVKVLGEAPAMAMGAIYQSLIVSSPNKAGHAPLRLRQVVAALLK